MDGDVDGRLELVAEREDLLGALADGPLSPRDVVDRTDCSRSTVNRALSDLESADLVERADGGYAATLAGRLALDRYRTVREEFAGLLDARQVLDPLDPDTPLDHALVTDAEAVVGSDATPYEPVERLHRAVRTADRYCAALPALEDPRHVRLLYEHVVTDDASATLVVAPDLHERLIEEFPRRMAAMADHDGFSLYTADVPPYGLVVTERDDGDATERTATVVVFADSGGVHGLLRSNSERAVRRADARIDGARDGGADRTDELKQPADGGVVPQESALAGPDLLVDLEREGVVRLSPSLFADRPVADPTTAWRAGLDLAEVHTGYAVARTPGDATAADGHIPADDGDATAEGGAAETLTDRLIAALADGEHRALVGPPGSGKSTALMRVACAWYDGDRGPVFYREQGAGRPLESVDALVATAEAAEGHPLVVVEDAVRPEADAVFDALDRLESAGASVLLDARESEWTDPPGERAAGAGADVEPVAMPALDRRDCERLIDHFERTVGTAVGAGAEELLADLRAEQPGDAERSDVVLLLHRLALYADPLADDETTLEAEVAAVHDDLSGVALDVATLATLLNAAGVALYPGLLHAVADPGEHAAVDGALDRLEGRVLFGRTEDGQFRAVHETWSVAFLAHLLDVDEAAARERVGRCVSALLALADDHERRDRIASRCGEYRGLDRVASAPGRWADETAEQLVALAEERPKLAPLFGTTETARYSLPEACSDRTAARIREMRGRAHLKRGALERARAAFDRRLETARADGDRRGEATALDRLGVVARKQADYDRAREHHERALEAFESVGDRRGAATARKNLGVVAWHVGDLDAAEQHLRESLEGFRALGDRGGEADSRNDLGMIAWSRGDLDDAAEQFEAALEANRELGDRRGQAECLNNLGAVATRREAFDRAEARYRRSLEVYRALGDRQGLARTHNNLGALAFERGALDDARRFHERSLEIKRDLGDRAGEATSLANLGELERAADNPDRARDRLEAALAIRCDLDAIEDELAVHHDLVELEREAGNRDRARERFERARDRARAADTTLEDAHEDLAALAERLFDVGVPEEG